MRHSARYPLPSPLISPIFYPIGDEEARGRAPLGLAAGSVYSLEQQVSEHGERVEVRGCSVPRAQQWGVQDHENLGKKKASWIPFTLFGL